MRYSSSLRLFRMLAPLIVLATACSTVHKPPTDSPTNSDESQSPTPSTMVTGGSSNSALPPNLSDLPSVHVPGVVSHQDEQVDPQQAIYMRWPEIAGLSELNKALADQVATFRKDFVAKNPRREQASPELWVGWQITAAAGNSLEVVLVHQWSAGNGSETKLTTFYAHGQQVLRGPDIFSKTGAPTIFAEVVRDLSKKDPQLAKNPDAKPTDEHVRELADGALLTSDGGLDVRVAQGSLAPESAGIPAVRIAADVVTPTLSPAGKALADDFRAGKPFAPTTSTAPASGSGTAIAPQPIPEPATPSPSAPAPAPTPAPAPAPAPAPPAVDCAATKCVALTFDDGPGPYTGKLLDILAEKNAKATFFMLGNQATRYPALVSQAAAAGMEIGNHTWEHKNLAKMSAEEQKADIEHAADAIAAAGAPRPTMLRPPYGSLNDGTKNLGVALILWNIDTEDWKNRDTQATTDRALTAPAGSIILMHDIRPTTVTAVPAIIDGLRAKGYTLVTVSQLVGPPAPGTSYFSQHDSR